MPAPTIVDQSFTTATADTEITIPAPAGLAEQHSLVAYLAAVVEHQSPPLGAPSGWSGPATEDQIGAVISDSGLGAIIAMSYTLDHAGDGGMPADYTFQLLTGPGFGGTPPANETPFLFAHGHLLALDRGVGGSVVGSDSALAFAADVDFGPGPDLVAPPSLMLNFLVDATGPSAAFGTVVADEGFTMIGAYDTTGMTAGDNLGARTISAIGSYGASNWAQLEEVFGTPAGAATVAAWGVLAR